MKKTLLLLVLALVTSMASAQSYMEDKVDLGNFQMTYFGKRVYHVYYEAYEGVRVRLIEVKNQTTSNEFSCIGIPVMFSNSIFTRELEEILAEFTTWSKTAKQGDECMAKNKLHGLNVRWENEELYEYKMDVIAWPQFVFKNNVPYILFSVGVRDDLMGDYRKLEWAYTAEECGKVLNLINQPLP